MTTPRHASKTTPTKATQAKRTTALAAAALLGLAGCGMLDGSSSRRDRDRDDSSRRRSEPRYDDRVDRDRPRSDDRSRTGDSRSGDTWYDDRRYDDDKNYDRDTRTRDSRPDAGVPRGATQAAIGEGAVSYRPTVDGRAYVTESEFDKVIWSGTVYQGETLEVVPKRDRVFVDRKEVVKAPMKDDIRYRIYFERDNGRTRF